MLEIELIFKIVGYLLTAIGSIVLTWRVKVILQWVVYTLTAHEISIAELIKILNNEPQQHLTITGTITLSGIDWDLLVWVLVCYVICSVYY